MGDTEDFFQQEDQVFSNKELLEINHLPQNDRIVGRDEEIEKLASATNPSLFGQSPSNVLIYGKTGTGKSLCSKHVARTAVSLAGEKGITVKYAYIDCSQDPTETQTVRALAKSFNDSDETGVTVPVCVPPPARRYGNCPRSAG